MGQIDQWWKRCKTYNFIVVGNGCCINRKEEGLTDDFFSSDEYILKKVDNPIEANLLIIQGPINSRMLNVVREVYQHMLESKLVIILGDCAKGKYSDQLKVIDDLEKKMNVDYYLPGCPPEKSAITNCLDQLRSR